MIASIYKKLVSLEIFSQVSYEYSDCYFPGISLPEVKESFSQNKNLSRTSILELFLAQDLNFTRYHVLSEYKFDILSVLIRN